MEMKLSAVCREQSNGSYYAECPELDGCYTQGDTREAALDGLRDLAASIIADGAALREARRAGARYSISETEDGA
jgi:predicted RNase H-like HicB family nuclease